MDYCYWNSLGGKLYRHRWHNCLHNSWRKRGLLYNCGCFSLGNFFTIQDVLTKYDPETVRFFIVRAHYRSALNYSDVHLDDARNALKRLYTALNAVRPEPVEGLASTGSARTKIDWNNPFAARFKAAMDEDFGTPEAVAVLFDLAGEVNKTKSAELAGLLKALGACLGLLQDDPKAFLQFRMASIGERVIASSYMDAQVVYSNARIESLIEQRAAAKKSKNFAAADRIRQDLLASGIVLKDSPAGTTWESQS